MSEPPQKLSPKERVFELDDGYRLKCFKVSGKFRMDCNGVDCDKWAPLGLYTCINKTPNWDYDTGMIYYEETPIYVFNIPDGWHRCIIDMACYRLDPENINEYSWNDHLRSRNLCKKCMYNNKLMIHKFEDTKDRSDEIDNLDPVVFWCQNTVVCSDLSEVK